MFSGIVQTSNLSNYTICSLPQSREAIPLSWNWRPYKKNTVRRRYFEMLFKILRILFEMVFMRN
jgi:hypothetical protein